MDLLKLNLNYFYLSVRKFIKIFPFFVGGGVCINVHANAPVENVAQTYLGYEQLSSNLFVDGKDCEDYAFDSLSLKNTLTEYAVNKPIASDRHLKMIASEKERIDKNSEIAAKENEKYVLESELIQDEVFYEVLRDRRTQASRSYRDCRNTKGVEGCTGELEEFLNISDQYKFYRTDVIEPKEINIIELSFEIIGLTDEVERIDAELVKLAEFLEGFDALEERVEEKRQQFLSNYLEAGSLREVDLYGTLIPSLQSEGGSKVRLLFNYNHTDSFGIGKNLGLIDVKNGVSIFGGNEVFESFTWPTMKKFGNVEGPKEEHLSLTTDIASTCAQFYPNDAGSVGVAASTALMLVTNKELNIQNEYIVNIDMETVAHSLIAASNSLGYISKNEVDDWVNNLVGLTIVPVNEGLDDEEFENISRIVKWDFVFQLLNASAIPVHTVIDSSCDTENATPWCRVDGWWISLENSLINKQDMLNNIVSHFDSQQVVLTDKLLYSHVQLIAAQKNAPRPVYCEEKQTLVDGECIDDLPECEEGEIIVDGQCQRICLPEQVFEDGVCVDVPPICEEGEELIDGLCQLKCPSHQVIEDNMCVDIPVVCEEGEELIDGICQLICPSEQLLDGDVCVDLPPTCEEGEELIDGACLLICPEGQVAEDGECIGLPPICEENEILVDGECRVLPLCEEPEIEIDGTCVLPPQCPPGSEFNGQVCEIIACDLGNIFIDGSCKNICPEGSVFSGGLCVLDNNPCPPGQELQGFFCVLKD